MTDKVPELSLGKIVSDTLGLAKQVKGYSAFITLAHFETARNVIILITNSVFSIPNQVFPESVKFVFSLLHRESLVVSTVHRDGR